MAQSPSVTSTGSKKQPYDYRSTPMKAPTAMTAMAINGTAMLMKLPSMIKSKILKKQNIAASLPSKKIARYNFLLLAHLRVYNPEFTHKQVLQAFGLKKALEIYTIRELRAMFGNSSSRSWYRLMVDARSVKLPQTHSPLSVIRDGIAQFKPTKLSWIKKKQLHWPEI